MKTTLFLFDLDGTLLDTAPGIIHCYHAVADRFGKPRLPAKRFEGGVIGGPLRQNLQSSYSLTDAQTDEAIEMYRQEYADRGAQMATHYNGLKTVLQRITAAGAKCAVATLKREDLARSMLQTFCLSQYFAAIYGMNTDDTRTKASIVQMCLEQFDTPAEAAILIGDSANDASGAAEAGVRCVGVGYGYGFKTEEQARAAHCAAYAATTSALLKIVNEYLEDAR